MIIVDELLVHPLSEFYRTYKAMMIRDAQIRYALYTQWSTGLPQTAWTFPC